MINLSGRLPGSQIRSAVVSRIPWNISQPLIFKWGGGGGGREGAKPHRLQGLLLSDYKPPALGMAGKQCFFPKMGVDKTIDCTPAEALYFLHDKIILEQILLQRRTLKRQFHEIQSHPGTRFVDKYSFAYCFRFRF